MPNAFRALRLGGALITLAGLNLAQAAPRVDVDQAEHDFGSVDRGTVVEHRFEISNLGDEPLVLKRVDFSIRGMTGRVQQNIEPGNSATLELRWDTRQYSGDWVGQARLETNDPQRRYIVLSMSGTVVPPIAVHPVPAVYLSQFKGESVQSTLEITVNQERPVNLNGLKPSSDRFAAALETVNPGRTFRLHVTAAQDADIGTWRDRLIVLTDDPEQPRIGIEVNLLVKPDVHVSESKIDFGEVRIASLQRGPDKLKLLTQSLIISRRQGEMNIEGYSLDIPFLTLSLDPKQPSQRFRVDVGLDLGLLRAGDFSGLIRLNTDDDQFPTLQIPVRIRVID